MCFFLLSHLKQVPRRAFLGYKQSMHGSLHRLVYLLLKLIYLLAFNEPIIFICHSSASTFSLLLMNPVNIMDTRSIDSFQQLFNVFIWFLNDLLIDMGESFRRFEVLRTAQSFPQLFLISAISLLLKARIPKLSLVAAIEIVVLTSSLFILLINSHKNRGVIS